MIKKSKKINSAKAMAAAKRSIEFWSAIDANKLSKIGKNEKDMDLVWPEKKREFSRFA
ncbi:hypothetical protein SC171_09505 [Pantoea cypripedii]|uniref:hypothetical protein n=1 Tax=Pantoea cypripedii TaxID=55209 RepID=UPI002FCB26E5